MQISTLFVDMTQLPLDTQPIYNKLFSILKTRVEERSGATVMPGSGGFTLTFRLDPAMAEEAFEICDTANGVQISGCNFNALMFGMGQFLHKSTYTEHGMTVTHWRGYSAPECPVRFLYYAIHFYNWYQNTSPEDLERYCEDMMLWGYNGFCGLFGRISYDGWDDPRMDKAVALQKRLFRVAKGLNMKTAHLLQFIDFKTKRPEFEADTSGIFGKNGNPICPEKPGAYEYLREILCKEVQLLQEFDLDYLLYFPYDEGGCSCEKCAPWGGNGYYKLTKKIHKDIQARFPSLKAEVILATWHFNLGNNDPRDFEWLDKAIWEDKNKGEDWVSYITLETRRGKPEFIAKHGVPGGVKGIDFPEITMHRLDPWGAFGANPLVTEVERIFGDVADVVHGGMTYTEGRFDDLNKAILAGIMWDKSRSSRENFDDYVGYEFRAAIADDLWEACRLIEENQLQTHHSVMLPADMDKVQRVLELGKKMDAQLPDHVKTGWRWRILYIRTVLDHARYTAAAANGWKLAEGLTLWRDRFDYWGKGMIGNQEAQTLLKELLEIYEMPMEYDAENQVLHFMLRPCHAEMYQ